MPDDEPYKAAEAVGRPHRWPKPGDTILYVEPDFPMSLKVGWRDYVIERWSHRDAVGADRHGETSHTGGIIRIDLSYGTRQGAATMLHEVMHAIAAIWRIKDDDDEERTVQMIEHGLATVWRDNPKVMAWIGFNLINGTN